MNRLILLSTLVVLLAGCAREGTRPVLPYPRDVAFIQDVPDVTEDTLGDVQEAH